LSSILFFHSDQKGSSPHYNLFPRLNKKKRKRKCSTILMVKFQLMG
jgi:hypothetical protein